MKRMMFGLVFGLSTVALPLSAMAAAQATPAAQTPPRPATTPAPQAPAPAAPSTAPKPAAPVAFPSDARIAYVDVQAILDRSTLGKAGQEKVRALQEKKSAELTAKNTELQKKQQEIQAGQSVLTPAVLAQRNAEATKLQSELQFMQQQAQTDLEALQEQLLREFQDKVLPIIEQVRTEKNLWIILAAGGGNNAIIAVNPGLDLSDEIVKRLDVAK